MLTGVVVLLRLGVPAARHEHRRPARVPARPHRPVRLDDDHGHHLVDVRHRLQGTGAHLEGARRQRGQHQGHAGRGGQDRCPSRTSCRIR